MTHPLDRPIWTTLTTRLAPMTEGGALARRLPAEVNLFAAAADAGDEAQAALAALIPVGGVIGQVELAAPQLPPGCTLVSEQPIDQMLLGDLAPGVAPAGEPLGPDDWPEMHALAALTKPGPFFARTASMGRFIGVRREGRLVAMAGERMRVPGMTEVSAVCTHPDWRGHGFAEALMRGVIGRLLDEGERCFLHVFPGNPAIAFYRRLGFERRQGLALQVSTRPVAGEVEEFQP